MAARRNGANDSRTILALDMQTQTISVPNQQQQQQSRGYCQTSTME